MKRKLITLAIACLPLTGMFAQSIPNSGFENWRTTYLPAEPGSWNTFNTLSYITSGKSTVSKSTDSRSGKYSALLTTSGGGGATIPGGLSFSTFEQLQALQKRSKPHFYGGIAYTDKPDSIRFSFKCKLTGTDKAQVGFIFKSNTAASLGIQDGAYGGDTFQISGSRSNWVDTTVRVRWGDSSLIIKINPDSLFTGIILGDFLNNKFVAGDWFMIDNIRMVSKSSSSISQLPNNDFETWDSTAVEDPEDWFSLNNLSTIAGAKNSVVKSTDKHSGNYALSLETTVYNLFGSDTLGVTSTGVPDLSGFTGGFAYTGTARPGKLSFYYKYTPANSKDSGLVGLVMSKNGTVTDSLAATLPAASSWTFYEMIIPSGTMVPDTANIVFSSSNLNGDPANTGVGSKLLVDDLAFEKMTGLDRNSTPSANLRLFPNPAQDKLYIQYFKQNKDAAEFTLTNAIGQVVMQNRLAIGALDNGIHAIELGKLPEGVYFYSVRSGADMSTGKLVIQK